MGLFSIFSSLYFFMMKKWCLWFNYILPTIIYNAAEGNIFHILLFIWNICIKLSLSYLFINQTYIKCLLLGNEVIAIKGSLWPHHLWDLWWRLNGSLFYLKIFSDIMPIVISLYSRIYGFEAGDIIEIIISWLCVCRLSQKK